MNVVLTGGAGFIGRYLKEDLEKLSPDVKVEVIDPKIHPNSTIMNKQLVDKLISKCDIVYHLGGSSGSLWFEDPVYASTVNNEGTLNILDACAKYKKKIVFASTSSGYIKAPIPHSETDPLTAPNFYTATKIFNEHSIELYNKLYGIEYVIARFSSVFGANENKGPLCNMITQFVECIKRGESPILYGDGTQTRDFNYVKDVASALVIARLLPNGIYNVSTNTETSFNEAVDIVNKVLGTDVLPVYQELDKSGVHAEYVMRQKLDNSKLKLYGWEPKYTLEEAIRDAYC